MTAGISMLKQLQNDDVYTKTNTYITKLADVMRQSAN
jgi:hypothetical protein